MMYFHRTALSRALILLRAKPLSTVLSALVIAIALTLPSLGYVLMNNLAGLAKDVSGRPQISVFLKNDATPEQTQALEKQLKADSRLASVQFISRDQALKQLSARGGFADVTAALEKNPLPDAFILEPKDKDPAVFDALRSSLQESSQVAHIQLDSAWVERLHALIQLGQSALLLLTLLLGTALTIVTFNTIRLQILTQRHEISVSLLLGATRQFVRAPFLYFGLLQGLLGGLLACGLVQLLLSIIAPHIQTLASTYSITLEMAHLKGLEILALLGFAMLLGWMGAIFSVARNLNDKPFD